MPFLVSGILRAVTSLWSICASVIHQPFVWVTERMTPRAERRRRREARSAATPEEEMMPDEIPETPQRMRRRRGSS